LSAPPFVHLHCHSHYSLLDGASPIKGLVHRAKELGMNALALTDHGNLYGALEFYKTCKDAGINPVLGYEAYVAPASRFDKSGALSSKEATYHLTLLAQNATGFRNLVKMSSRAFLEGFYHKPRIDRELLEQYSEGIICLSGCVSGEFSRALLQKAGDGIAGHGGGNGANGAYLEDQIEKAREIAAWFHRVFGDRYFIEIQDNGLEIQRLAKEAAIEVAHRMGLPLVATSDAHYVRQEDAIAQDVLLCINTGKFRTDANRMRMEGDQFFLRSADEMFAALPDQEEALRRSQLIADSVDIDLELGKRHFPAFKVPEQKSPPDYLRELCIRGLKERYANNCTRLVDGDLTAEVYDRLNRELDVINKLGFCDYFLIVWDFVRFAVEKDIPCTARGSGVGSLVCYALRLSHVCPLEYDLLFERFLDESRLDAPDIDIDFCKERRNEVLQYVKDKYGEANVAQIGTFGTLAARAAIRDVGRTLGLPIFRVDQIVAMVPEQLHITIDKALDTSDELRQTYEKDHEVRELIDLARKIEGLARNVGTHAAAVVIAERPVDEYVPLQQVKGKTEVITQWAMGDVEAAGLLKMDFLGLRNLTILARSVALIEQSHKAGHGMPGAGSVEGMPGPKIDPYAFPLDDKETFALLCRGETKGIFQLEGGGIRDLLQRMKPDHFRDIIATNAMYRPGPLEGGMVDQYIEVKHGRKPAEYPHPVCEEILAETHGVMVYQEQVMRILNRLGGIALSNAYTCIKAISKKKLPIIARYREEFIAGAKSLGLDERKSSELFGMIEKFAGYGFNKSHSTAYALIAYMTAYLKAHYPVEFMAALLSCDIPGRNFKSKDALVEHIEDCRRMHIELLPPDVNGCDPDFKVENGKIHFGLSAVKACGGQAAEVIAEERVKNGPFASIFDFCERVDPAFCNRATIEALIKAGAFDSLGGHRAQCMAVLDRALQSGAAAAADRRSGQKGLFGDDDDAQSSVSTSLPNVPPWSDKEQLTHEKEVLGFYLSSHPLAEYEQTLRTFCTHTSKSLGSLAHRDEVLLGGMLAAIKFSHTKNPRPGSVHTKYAMWDLEDMDGITRCILWPEQFAEHGPLVIADSILAVKGKIDRRPGAEETNLIVDELIPLADLSERYSSGVIIRVREQDHGPRGLEQLREILRGYPGSKKLKLRLDLAAGGQVWLDSKWPGLDLNPELRERVEGLLGPGSIAIQASRPAPKNGNGSNGNHQRQRQPLRT
jgi:DNA polymerase-3 subunit alpha